MGFPRSLEDPEVINAVSGAIAGAITATFVCPLDVLKTRLHIQKLGHLKGGVLGGLTQIARAEGLSGLYKGLTPTLLALLPNWAVYFTVYDKLKEVLADQVPGSAVPPRAGPAVHMLAAAGAGAATLAVTNPLWVVKTRIQTQNLLLSLGSGSVLRLRYHVPYRNTFDALNRICREEGVRGLYSGLAPSMMGIFHVAIQFPMYEYSKQRVAEHYNKSVNELTPMELVATSAFSKLIASTATYPHEVIRSCMHVAGSGPVSGIVDAVRTILREDGVRGLYRGCAINLLRTTPAAAITFTSFELMARYLRGML